MAKPVFRMIRFFLLLVCGMGVIATAALFIGTSVPKRFLEFCPEGADLAARGVIRDATVVGELHAAPGDRRELAKCVMSFLENSEFESQIEDLELHEIWFDNDRVMASGNVSVLTAVLDGMTVEFTGHVNLVPTADCLEVRAYVVEFPGSALIGKLEVANVCLAYSEIFRTRWLEMTKVDIDKDGMDVAIRVARPWPR